MSRIGILVFREFEDAEVAVPIRTLEDAGHELVLIGHRPDLKLRGWKGRAHVTTDAAFDGVRVDTIDALFIPGDESPERLRSDAEAVDFVRRFWRSGRPIAAIEEGIELLRSAGVLEGVCLTSAPAFRHQLQNAGARWVDRDVVIDGNVLTARSRTDLETLCATLEQRL